MDVEAGRVKWPDDVAKSSYVLKPVVPPTPTDSKTPPSTTQSTTQSTTPSPTQSTTPSPTESTPSPTESTTPPTEPKTPVYGENLYEMRPPSFPAWFDFDFNDRVDFSETAFKGQMPFTSTDEEYEPRENLREVNELKWKSSDDEGVESSSDEEMSEQDWWDLFKKECSEEYMKRAEELNETDKRNLLNDFKEHMLKQ